jgi:iron complex outermembrane receptor protein
VDVREWPVNDYHYHEARLASNSEGSFSWLVGANYFKHEYEQYFGSYQTRVTYEDPDISAEDAFMVMKWDRSTSGSAENFGIFTEETFNLSDDFRITAGLRYDKTEIDQLVSMRQNLNQTALGTQVTATPETMNILPPTPDNRDFDNFTYKLRFEYDLTPDNMVYFLTSTGFLPGAVSLSPDEKMQYQVLVLPQQELVSYEVGSKNLFLDNTLRLNAALFYYDYEGLPEAVNVVPYGGPPVFDIMPIEVDIMGLELDVEYLVTPYDKISLSVGYLKTEITQTPDTMLWIPRAPPWDTPDPSYTTAGSDAFILDELPNHPDLTATLAYDHTFMLSDGSTLVPRAELVYTSDYYFEQMNYIQINSGLKPYNERKALTLINIGATWTSARDMFSITAYGRNLLDEEYKARLGRFFTTSTTSNIEVIPGDPLTWGLMVSFKY